LSNIKRISRICYTALRYRLDEMIDNVDETHHIPGILGSVLRYSPLHLLPQPKDSLARRLRLAIESLGPVFIKFGQILSTRRDLLPEDYAIELAMLQDKVPPFPSDQAMQLVEQSLGQKLTEVFANFDEEPLASASVAQVHSATLLDGTEVVVKIIRPEIEKIIQQDLKLLLTLARNAERLSLDARRLHLIQIVEDYEFTIMNELNLKLEGANTTKLRRNFAGSELLYVPRVYWEHTRERILVMERIYGTSVREVETLRRQGTDMKLLAERGVETFFTQVFNDNFFHADMHPGNIFIDLTHPDNPKYIAIDCAIMGSLTQEDQRYLAHNLLAFFNQDYKEVVRLHLESGWVPTDTDAAAFETVIREVCEPIFEKPLSEISFGYFLVTLFQTARAFNMEVQPQLVLLQKTLLNIEGVGRELYPDLNLWETAKPFMERWMAERLSPVAALQRMAEHAPEIIEALPRIPDLLMNTDRDLRLLRSTIKRQKQSLDELNKNLASRQKTARRTRLFGALLIIAGGTTYYLQALPLSLNAIDSPYAIVAIIAGVFLITR